jgi:hypothetical protein
VGSRYRRAINRGKCARAPSPQLPASQPTTGGGKPALRRLLELKLRTRKLLEWLDRTSPSAGPGGSQCEIRSGTGPDPWGSRRERRVAWAHRSSRTAYSPMGTRQPWAAAVVAPLRSWSRPEAGRWRGGSSCAALLLLAGTQGYDIVVRWIDDALDLGRHWSSAMAFSAL